MTNVDERKEELLRVADGIVSRLPPWHIYRENDFWNVKLIRDDMPDAGLWIGWEKNTGGKLHIAGDYPQGYSPYEPPSIGISSKRPFEVIAREVKSRFLPIYFEAFNKACERHDEVIEIARRTNELLDFMHSLYPLATVKHSAISAQGGADEGQLFTRGLEAEDSFEVKVSTYISKKDGSQNVSFTMPSARPETVCALLRMLGKAQEEATKALPKFFVVDDRGRALSEYSSRRWGAGKLGFGNDSAYCYTSAERAQEFIDLIMETCHEDDLEQAGKLQVSDKAVGFMRGKFARVSGRNKIVKVEV